MAARAAVVILRLAPAFITAFLRGESSLRGLAKVLGLFLCLP